MRNRFLGPAALAVFVGAMGTTYFTTHAPPATAASYGSGAQPSAPPPTVAVDNSASTVQTGKSLFIANCSSCHGVSAQGSAYAPNLVGLGAATIDFWVATGRMPLSTPTAQAPQKASQFSAGQRHAIVAYVTSLGAGGPGIPNVNVKGANLAAGQELFSLNCAGCHTISGAGDALSAGYYAPSLMVATKTEIGEAMRTGPGNMPRFGPHTLSPSQVNDIAAYVSEVLQHPVDRGGIGLGHVGPVAEGFITFLVGIGSLLLLAYWIGEVAEKRHPHEIAHEAGDQ